MKSINQRQARETGLLLALALLAVQFFKTGSHLSLAAIGIILLTMVVPALFKPLAFLWFKLALALNFLFSRVMLTLLFFGLVLPVGFLRKLSGKDPLLLRSWKSADSAFVSRGHAYSREDLETPF